MLVTKIMQPNCLYVSHIDLSMKPHFWRTDPGKSPTQNKERERERSHIFKKVHESTRSPTITNLIRENVFSKCNHIVCRPTLTIYKNNNHPTNRHTDNSRSPAPDIAVPRQALCYLSRSNRGLKNRRLFLQHPLFLALVNPGNHKPQNAEPSKRIINRALNKHRISQNQ